MTIEGTLTAGQLLAVLVTLLIALLGGAWALMRIVATQFSMRMDLKFEALGREVKARDDALARIELDNRRLEREFADFRLHVATHHVTQDQKVALETALIGRMDGLAHQFEKLINVART